MKITKMKIIMNLKIKIKKEVGHKKEAGFENGLYLMRQELYAKWKLQMVHVINIIKMEVQQEF
jgi:hypothetical protein